MVISGVEGGNGTGTEFFARVAGVDVIGSREAARMLPKAAALIPMKAQTPKGVGSGRMLTGREVQPYPTANDFRQFVLLGQLGFEQVQDGLGGQLPVGVVSGHALAGF